MPDAPGGPIVLDTHVWLWVIEGERSRVSKSAILEIEKASARGSVRVSAISVWEVAMLESRGRIGLSQPLEDWVHAALRAPGVQLLHLTPAVAIESTRLPGGVNRDPADRMLIASARIVGGRLATCDDGIIDYSREGHLAVLDARG